MLPEDKYFHPLSRHKAWQRYCGFLDLSIPEFIQIQERLLTEQIGLMTNSPLGRKIMEDRIPGSIEEFRSNVRLTTYQDYAPYIGEGQEDLLGEKPHYWVHTSTSQGAFKRVPWTYRFHQVQIRNIMAALILSSARKKGDVRLRLGCKILALVPERPFVSAQLAFGLEERFTAEAVLPLETCEKLPFAQKVDAGFEQAMSTDIDYIVSMASTFLPMQRIFDQMASERKPLFNIFRLHNNVALRVLKHSVGNLFGKRKMIAPKDLWDIKGIVSWGADTSAFAPIVQEQWDQWMLQSYGSSEAGMVATQDWRKDGMTFLPDSVFLEFLPEEANGQGNGHTLLIDQLEPGKRYEPVITSLYGMPFVRYRQGDLIEVVPDEASSNGDRLPKVVFHNRADDLIDLFGIARLVTKTIEEALNQTGIPHGQWSVRKDHEGDRPIMRLYIELHEEGHRAKLAHRLHRKLMSVDRHYAEAVFVVGYNPIRVVPIKQGTFERYAKSNMNGSRGMDHYMPPRMNITDLVAAELMQFNV